MAEAVIPFVDGANAAPVEAMQPIDPLEQEHLRADDMLRDTWFVGFSEVHDNFFKDDATRHGITIAGRRYSLTNELNGTDHIRSVVVRTQQVCSSLLMGRALCFLTNDMNELFAGKHKFTERIGSHGEVLQLVEGKREPLVEDDYAVLDLISRAVERSRRYR